MTILHIFQQYGSGLCVCDNCGAQMFSDDNCDGSVADDNSCQTFCNSNLNVIIF